MGKTGTTETGGGAEGAKLTGRELLHEYALPIAVAVATGVVAGAIAVKVVGLTVVMGVATGIVTAAATFQKLGELWPKARE